MARTQFKVTFTNAQPGAPVSILTPSVEHVYSSAAATKPVGGKQLYLDATNAITVWSDAQDVIAQTVDGAGLFIQGTATVASPTVTVGDGTAPTNPAGSAASGASETLLIQLWQDGFFDGNIHVTVDPTASVADPLAGQAGACRQLILPPVAIASGGICGVTVANNGTAAVVVASVALTVSNLTGTETFQASASDVTVAAGAWVGVDMTGSAGAGTHLSWDAVGQNVATDAADVFWAQLRVQLAPNS